MSWSGSIRGLIFALTPIVTVYGSAPCSFAEETPAATEAQALIEGLVEWKSAFHNFRVVTRWNNPGQWIHRRPELAAPGALDGYYHIEDWIYSDDDRSRFEHRAFENGVMVAREIHANDGQQHFTCDFKGTMDVPAALRLSPTPQNRILQEGSKFPFASLHMGNKRWIGTVFRNQPMEVVRQETIDGTRCAVIRHAVLPQNGLPREWYLDLEHDGLIKFEDERTGHTRKVTEFRKLDHGRWFPWKGTMLVSKNDTPYEWEVLEAEVNLELTAAHFAPPQPGPSTLVTGPNTGALPVSGASPSTFARDPGGVDTFWFACASTVLIGLVVAAWVAHRKAARSRSDIEHVEPPPLPRSIAVFAPWTWPRWNRWLLIGLPALVVLYVLSIAPALLLDQQCRGSLNNLVHQIYYPLMAVSEEFPPTQTELDRYCRLCGTGAWRMTLTRHRSLALERQMRAAERNPPWVMLATALTVGLATYWWRKRSAARRNASMNRSAGS